MHDIEDCSCCGGGISYDGTCGDCGCTNELVLFDMPPTVLVDDDGVPWGQINSVGVVELAVGDVDVDTAGWVELPFD